MLTMAIGRVLAPFAALLLIWAVAAPIRRQVQRMPECRLKRILLMQVN